MQLGLYRDNQSLLDEGLDLWSSIVDNMLKWGSETFTAMTIPQPNMTLVEEFYRSNSTSALVDDDGNAKMKAAKHAAALEAAGAGLNDTLGQAAGAALAGVEGKIRSAAASAGLVVAAVEQTTDGSKMDARGNAAADVFFQRLLEGGLLRLGQGPVVVQRGRGETLETLRDFFHAQFGLGGLLQVAELAWQQVRGRMGHRR